MPAPDFLTPAAFTADGVYTTRDDADKALRYVCPGCRGAMIVKSGDRVRKHFAHLHEADGVGCSGESVIHNLAKHRIVTAVAAMQDGGPRPKIRRPCPGCGFVVFQRLPLSMTASVEWHHGSGRVLDVALFAGAAVMAGVEILHTHRVDAAKAADLAPLPWVELKAEDVIDNPLVWRPKQDFFRRWDCVPCIDTAERERRQRERERDQERAYEAEREARMAKAAADAAERTRADDAYREAVRAGDAERVRVWEDGRADRDRKQKEAYAAAEAEAQARLADRAEEQQLRDLAHQCAHACDIWERRRIAGLYLELHALLHPYRCGCSPPR